MPKSAFLFLLALTPLVAQQPQPRYTDRIDVSGLLVDVRVVNAAQPVLGLSTGGFFVRTHIFTRRAFDNLAAALAGHYVLFVEKPDLRAGAHRVEVKLVRRDGSVFAKHGYVD